jgi:hypothetical protein
MAVGKHSNQMMFLQVFHLILVRLEDFENMVASSAMIGFFLLSPKKKKKAQNNKLGLTFEGGLMFLSLSLR